MHRHLAELGFYVGGTSLLLLMLASTVAAWGVRRRLAPLRELAAERQRDFRVAIGAFARRPMP